MQYQVSLNSGSRVIFIVVPAAIPVRKYSARIFLTVRVARFNVGKGLHFMAQYARMTVQDSDAEDLSVTVA